jgi:hypothetical protein
MTPKAQATKEKLDHSQHCKKFFKKGKDIKN